MGRQTNPTLTLRLAFRSSRLGVPTFVEPHDASPRLDLLRMPAVQAGAADSMDEPTRGHRAHRHRPFVRRDPPPRVFRPKGTTVLEVRQRPLSATPMKPEGVLRDLDPEPIRDWMGCLTHPVKLDLPVEVADA